MAATRTRVITYGAFDTSATGHHLDAVDSIDFDERSFRIAFDVVLRFGTDDELTTAEQTMRGILEDRNLPLEVVSSGTTKWKFVDGTGTVNAGEEGAEFIKASLTSLGSHRTSKSSAWRIVVEVTRAANLTGRPGVLSQSARTTESPNGIRRLSFRAQFTPGPSSAETGDAEDRFADGDYGFDALVEAVTTTLTGTWERDGSLTKTWDQPSRRTLTASASYRELIFDQSSRATNDSELVAANYDVVVNRTSAFSIPGESGVAPLTAVTVLFSSGVVKTVTDFYTLIDSVVLPYCASAVATRLGVTGLKEMNHTLRHDPTNSTISGQVFYLAARSNVLELSKRVGDIARTGDNLVPVLDPSNKWLRDKWKGPGFWVRRVTIGARVLGLGVVGTLDRIEAAEVAQMRAAGFEFLGWGIAGSPSVELFEDAGSSIVTTVETRTLEFERADIRQGGGGTAVADPPAAENAAGGGGDFLASFKERT